MNKDKLLKWAQESGFWQEHTNTWMCNTQDIERLIDRVRHDEREQCARVCETRSVSSVHLRIAAAAIRARNNT